MEKLLKAIQKVSPILINATLYLGGLTLITIGIYKLVLDNLPISSLALTGGLLMLLAASIERFEVLKGFGIEAKTRELDRKITEAEDIFNRMRRIAEITCSTLIRLNSQTGRLVPVPRSEDSYYLVSTTKDILNELGTDREAIREILKPWMMGCLYDLIRRIKSDYKKYETDAVRQLKDEIKDAQKQNDKSLIDALEEKLKTATAYSEVTISYDDPIQDLKRYYLDHPLLPEQLKPQIASELSFWEKEVRILMTTTTLNNEDRWHSRINETRY